MAQLNLSLESADEMLLADGSSKLILFDAVPDLTRRAWPHDLQREFPPRRDTTRNWPDN